MAPPTLPSCVSVDAPPPPPSPLLQLRLASTSPTCLRTTPDLYASSTPTSTSSTISTISPRPAIAGGTTGHVNLGKGCIYISYKYIQDLPPHLPNMVGSPKARTLRLQFPSKWYDNLTQETNPMPPHHGTVHRWWSPLRSPTFEKIVTILG